MKLASGSVSPVRPFVSLFQIMEPVCDHLGRKLCGALSKRRGQRCAALSQGRACQQSIKTVIAIYPDSIAVAGKVFPQGRPLHVVRVSFPDELFALSVLEQMRALREANKQINAELRILRAAKKHVLGRLHELGEIIERECEQYEQSQAEGAGIAKPNGSSTNGTSNRSEK